MARWLAVLMFGFVAGAGTVLLADPGDETRLVVPAASAASDGHSHDHGESDITYAELTGKTKAEVDEVIAAFATKYTTAADAMADGWFRGTRNLYGIGAHYLKSGDAFRLAVPFDLLDPPILLFDGDGPDAKFAGVSYVVDDKTPEGFTGPLDVFHTHTSVCMMGGTVVSVNEDDSNIWYSEDECTEAGGSILSIASDNMIHVWIGPDYLDNAPIFAHDHPKLYDGYSPKLSD